MAHEAVQCPTMHPTYEEFRQPFTAYVSSVFKAHPDLALFKIVPPRGWRPSRHKLPDMHDVTIATPILQHVFAEQGSKGAYRCVFEERKPMNGATFQATAEAESVLLQQQLLRRKEQRGSGGLHSTCDDAAKERAFWSSITLTAPLYGADTPTSFFDEHLATGWNLRDLGDLLKTHHVPPIPGVTSPMMYFGMWRSFFGWHIEDADLYSTNYLHFGAAKVWYSVSPKDSARFESMVQNLYPQLYRGCRGFIRHKDIMINPSLLRMHNIPFMQAKQEAGEYVVLNAGAYHSGFNTGFNCAEAVNFGMEEWIPLGKAARASRCTCDALNEGVRIDMAIFDPTWRSDSDYSGDGDSVIETSNMEGEEGEEAGPAAEGDAEEEVRSAAAAAVPDGGDGLESGKESEEEDSDGTPPPRNSKRARARGGGSSGGGASGGGSGDVKGSVRGAKGRFTVPVPPPSGSAKAAAAPRARASSAPASTSVASASAKPSVKGGAAAAAVAVKGRSLSAPAAATATVTPRAPVQAEAAVSGGTGGTGGTAAAEVRHSKRAKSAPVGGVWVTGAAATPAAPRAPAPGGGSGRSHIVTVHTSLPETSAGASDGGGVGARLLKAGNGGGQGLRLGEGDDTAAVVGGSLAAIVGEVGKHRRFFQVVQQLQRSASTPGHVVLQLLKKSQHDQLFRPVQRFWEERADALVRIRTQYERKPLGGAPPGWKLRMLDSRILKDTDLQD